MSNDICMELRDVSRREKASGISGCCLDAANEIERLRAENEALKAELIESRARHMDDLLTLNATAKDMREQAQEIERLKGLLRVCDEMTDSRWPGFKPLKQQIRSALAAKGE